MFDTHSLIQIIVECLNVFINQTYIHYSQNKGFAMMGGLGFGVLIAFGVFQGSVMSVTFSAAVIPIFCWSWTRLYKMHKYLDVKLRRVMRLFVEDLESPVSQRRKSLEQLMSEAARSVGPNGQSDTDDGLAISIPPTPKAFSPPMLGKTPKGASGRINLSRTSLTEGRDSESGHSPEVHRRSSLDLTTSDGGKNSPTDRRRSLTATPSNIVIGSPSENSKPKSFFEDDSMSSTPSHLRLKRSTSTPSHLGEFKNDLKSAALIIDSKKERAHSNSSDKPVSESESSIDDLPEVNTNDVSPQQQPRLLSSSKSEGAYTKTQKMSDRKLTLDDINEYDMENKIGSRQNVLTLKGM
jgi:hypothetical protein